MVIVIIVAVLLVAFIFQNTESANLNWLFFDFTTPLWLILALTALVAFGIGWLIGRRRGPGRDGSTRH